MSKLVKAFFLFLILIGLAAIYLVPKMINQRAYDNYFLHVPDKLPDSGKYPLILFLHGSGSRGNDLEKVKRNGPIKYLEKNPDFPFVILAPQCKQDDSWHSLYLIRLIDSICAKFPIDEKRIYATGLSMGGVGTWHLAQDAQERFAAVAPICGRSHYDLEQLNNAKNLPIWAFHGEKDDMVPYTETQRLVDKLEAIGGDVKFTLYPELNHDSWTVTYDNPELYAWFLSKVKE